MKTVLKLTLTFLLTFTATAQTGVVVPLPGGIADESVLAIDSVDIRLCVDNQTVKARVTQVFINKTAGPLEGKYLFALPETANVADFAVWDGIARIPGVMLEKRRANKIYGEIKSARTDPGILQTNEDAAGRTAFSARLFPIPAFGTKRVEIEYQQNLPVNNFASRLTFPLRASFGEPQTARRFRLSVCAANDLPMDSVSYDRERFPLVESENTPASFAGTFEAEDYRLDRDFSLNLTFRPANSLLSFITFRAPETITAFDLKNPRLANRNADGFFEMRALFNEPSNEQRPPRSVLIAIDTSLSMYGEKLRRAVEATDAILDDLDERDEFSLILFSDQLNPLSPAPLAATDENTERARDFLRNSTLGGGTNLKAAIAGLRIAAEIFSNPEKQVFIVSDGDATRETVRLPEILKSLENGSSFIHYSTLALGDIKSVLLAELAKRTGGSYFQARETEDVTALTTQWLAALGAQRFGNFGFSSSDAANFYDVYATGEYAFNGSDVAFVGRYRRPGTATVKLQAAFAQRTLAFERSVALPEFDSTHDHLPRLWARARIDALVREMDLGGEDADLIDEIIALSQKYKLVSPYTAFVAAPRALLRPRLIQPGDPVIRVKTDSSVKSVTAVLPFGETLPLRFLAAEGVWETRFLAPVWMTDGGYTCRLLLVDADGNGFEEPKTFVVDSQAPIVKITPDKTTYRGAETIELRVSADRDTVNLSARIENGRAIRLFWSDAAKANIGSLPLPSELAPGRYKLTVTAEDAARNLTTEEVSIEISR